MSIKAEHLTYKYGDGTAFEQYALKDVNFEIPDGQFVGLIGHTGSGKSTLIQHLNGLIKPTSGRILYNGTDIHSEGYSLKKLRSKVGLVFQYPEHQLFEIDVFSDVCFGPKNLGFSDEEIKNRAEEALRLVKLDEKFWKQSPFELSGGQKRRVAIAGVLAMGPEVLILDEPTAGLDPRGRDEILDQIREEKLDIKVQGDSLVLTLNTQLQQVCYDALGDNKGAIVVLEPSTGKVLAMVSKPDFDPNTIEQDWDALINDDSNSSLFNRALQGQYPPGSTFKIITMSAGLSEGVVSPNDSFFCPGYKIVEDRRIHCHKRTGHGAENFVQGAQNSCNPVFIEVGLRLGVEKFCDYFRKFGLMEKTGIDLPGEASTIMHKEENIGEVELATMASTPSLQIFARPRVV